MKLGKIVGLALMALTLGLAGQSLAAEPIKIGVYLPLRTPLAASLSWKVCSWP